MQIAIAVPSFAGSGASFYVPDAILLSLYFQEEQKEGWERHY